MEDVKKDVKELLLHHAGEVLGEREQSKLYKRIKKIVATTPFVNDFNTVYKACQMCDLDTKYYKSEFENWSLLTIFDTDELYNDGKLSYIKREHDNKKKAIDNAKDEINSIKAKIYFAEKEIEMKMGYIEQLLLEIESDEELISRIENGEINIEDMEI